MSMKNYENYDPYFPDQPVVDLYLPLWASLPSFQSKPAFIWTEPGPKMNSTLTYGQLNHSVQSIASHLPLHLGRGETVVLLCQPGLELVEILFGCQRSGVLTVPVYPPDPSFSNENYHHLVRVLSQTKPKAAIANDDYIQSIRRYISSSNNKHLCELLQTLKWISTDELINNKNVVSKCDSLTYTGCKQDEVYLIQYTSGATGIPKPVLLTAGSAAHNVRSARKSYDLHPNSIIISWLPQYHDCGLMFLLLTIVSGSTCILTSPSSFLNRPRLWLELITEYKGTCTPVPSFTLPLVLKRGGIDKGTMPINLWSLKNLIIINEPVYKALVEDFVNQFKPLGLNPSCISPSYGLAENCTFVSTAWRRVELTFERLPCYNKLLPSARLASMNREEEEEEEGEMKIIVVNEETKEIVEDGTEGEIWLASPSNADGYLGHPSLTQEVFNARLTDKLSRCFVKTGDRGVVKGEERFLFVTGRSLDVIKLHGGREVHPHYIETAAYNSCPRYLRGGCLSAFEISRGIVVVAEMQRKESEVRFLRRICEGIREGALKEENVEVGFVVLVKNGSVPKTTSGKVQRWMAKDRFLRGDMHVIMKMEFGDGGVLVANGEKGKRIEEERSRIMVNVSGEDNRLSLLSFL